MTKKTKIIIYILLALLVLFIFPKQNGSWTMGGDKDYHCKCLGYEYLIGSGIKSNKPGNSLCFGIPCSCGKKDLSVYFGK
jgi:hypothetical protein